MSLIARYTFDGDLNDHSGKGNDLTLTGSNIFETGKIGQAGRKSDGAYTSPINQLHADLSICLWYKHHGENWLSECIFGTRTGSNGFMFYRNDGDTNNYHRIYFWYVNTSGSVVSYRAWPGIYGTTADEWHHFAMVRTYDGYLTIYRDGIAEYEGTPPADFSHWHNNNQDLAFHGQGNGSSYTAGDVSFDEIKVYNNALSKSEVLDDYYAKVLHYSFDSFAEPTTNYLVDGVSGYTALNPSHWNGTTLAEVGTSDLGTPIIKYDTNGTSYTYTHDYVLDDNLITLSGQTVTFSLYMRQLSGDVTGRIRIYDNVSGYSYYSVALTNSFKRFEATKILGANPTRIFVMIDNTGGGVYEFHSTQLEIKDHATPFVNGSRQGTVIDESGHGYDAVLAENTTPKWTEDSKIGKGCFDFTKGLEQRIQLPVINAYDKTISFFVKVKPGSHLSTERVVFMVYNDGVVTGSGDTNQILLCMQDNHFQMHGWGSYDPGCSTNINDGDWHHVVWQMKYHPTDGTQRLMNMWTDGVQEVSNYNYDQGNDMSPVTDSNWWIGYNARSYSPYTRDADILIDDVRIYATALPASEIKKLAKTMGQVDSRGNLKLRSLSEIAMKPLILDYTTWEDGQTGSVGVFNDNGSAAENHRILAPDPWGKETVVWEARPDATSGADGGWNASAFPVDNTKMYRFSTWVWRNMATDGRFYLGIDTYDDTAEISGLTKTGGSGTNLYPYNTITGIPVGVWTLVVFHAWPAGTPQDSVNHEDSGRFTVKDGKVGNISYDIVMPAAATRLRHRTYLYYSTNTTQRQRWVYPRVDICDGMEPSIQDLLNGFDSNYIGIIRAKGQQGVNLNVGSKSYTGLLSEVGPTRGLVGWWPLNGNLKDYSGNGYHGTMSGPVYASGIGQSCIDFDGSGRIDVSSFDEELISCTISFWTRFSSTTPAATSIIEALDSSGNRLLNVHCPWSNSNVYWDFGNHPYARVYTTVSPGWSNWHHWSFTIDSRKTTMRIYLNGVLLHESATTGKALTDTISTMKIGSSATNTNGYSGKVQDFRIYNTALTQQEVSTLAKITDPRSKQTIMMTEDNGVYIKDEVIED